MHALVSTVRFILLVDLATGKVEAVEAHRPEYYGISWFPGSCEIVLSHSAVHNDDLVDIASIANSEVGYISEGKRRSLSFLSAPHQIVCASDGRIIVTNTGRNRLQILDLDKPGHVQEAGISEGRWDRLHLMGPFGDHLNSVFERGGRLYAIAHGYQNGSKLTIFSYPDMTLISVDRIPNVTGVHNVFVEDDGSVIGCHSEVGGLIDLKSASLLWQSGSCGYTRGLAASEDCLLIGESEITTREKRASCFGGIWMIDRRTYETKDYVPLGPYGAVHEVRLIDVPDFAHHGVPLSGGRASITARVSDVAKAARLRSSGMAAANALFWVSFTPVLGTAAIAEEGWKAAGEDIFLTIRRDPSTVLAIKYELNATGTSHVSLVADYRGNGADANMDAFLLQRSGTGAMLQLWRHEGIEWTVAGAARVGGLPLTGEMEIRTTGRTASIYLGGAQVLADIALQNHAGAGGRLGIRAVGASIRPLDRR